MPAEKEERNQILEAGWPCLCRSKWQQDVEALETARLGSQFCFFLASWFLGEFPNLLPSVSPADEWRCRFAGREKMMETEPFGVGAWHPASSQEVIRGEG